MTNYNPFSVLANAIDTFEQLTARNGMRAKIAAIEVSHIDMFNLKDCADALYQTYKTENVSNHLEIMGIPVTVRKD